MEIKAMKRMLQIFNVIILALKKLWPRKFVEVFPKDINL